jgi:hypothetical protein
MAYQNPPQQMRYADNGRREITLLNRQMPASLVKLRESDARLLSATHEIFVDKIAGVSPQQIVGQTIDFGGRSFRAVKVTDPRAADPVMRGRYYRIICVEAETT